MARTSTLKSNASSPAAPTAFSPILYFAPELVVELALGADHPHDVAERYGVDAVQYEHLASLPWFHELVARKRQELQDQGLIFQTKAAMMAEALLTRLFQQSMAAAIPPPLTVEVAKQLTEIGRLKPLPGSAGAGVTTPGFQINIQVNGEHTQLGVVAPGLAAATPGTSPAETPLDAAGASGPAEAGPASPASSSPRATMKLAFKGLPRPPDYVSNLKVPDFDVRHPGAASLTGSPAARVAAAQAAPDHVGLPSTRP